MQRNIIIIILLIASFSHQFHQVVFHWRKFPQVCRIIQSILADFSSVMARMVSILPLISCSSSFFPRFLVTVSKATITFSIILTFIFYNLFSSLAKSRYLSSFSPSFTFTLCSAGKSKFTIWQVIFFHYHYY